MVSGPEGLAARLRANRESVLSRIAAAALRSGRRPESVSLVAVTKSVSAGIARAFAEATGARDFGENRVVSAIEKIGSLRDLVPPIRWHLIGHLQTNKARKAVESFDVIHSVDSLHLAAAIDKAASAIGRVADFFVQVNVSGESTKSGFEPSELGSALERMSALHHARITGLMTMAPIVLDPESVRPVFGRLRRIAEAEASRGRFPAPPALSMGMSQDFEVAVEEGATHVRVGTALFEGATDERLLLG